MTSKAAGYKKLVDSCNGDAEAAARLLLIEKMEELVARQVEAIQNLKIDKITVWDSGGSNGSTTANFLSGMVQSLPPLQDISKLAGIELPDFLGKMIEEKAAEVEESPTAPVVEEPAAEEMPSSEA